jgi:hypothetical protein
MRDMNTFKQPVVPALLMTLAMLVQSQELGGRKVKFGARVQQAKSLCTDRANCQFGYTFDGQLRENVIPGSEGSDFREIVFVPPTATPAPDSVSRRREKQGSIPEQQFDNQSNFPPTQKAPRRRRLRLNIDPRRRTQQSRVDTTTELTIIRNTSPRARLLNVAITTNTNRKDHALERKKPFRNRKVPEQQRSFDLFEPAEPGKLFNAFPEDENTVTINIGGTPIVIPDFDLSPQPHEKHVSLTRNTSPKPTRKAAKPQNQRKK